MRRLAVITIFLLRFLHTAIAQDDDLIFFCNDGVCDVCEEDECPDETFEDEDACREVCVGDGATTENGGTTEEGATTEAPATDDGTGTPDGTTEPGATGDTDGTTDVTGISSGDELYSCYGDGSCERCRPSREVCEEDEISEDCPLLPTCTPHLVFSDQNECEERCNIDMYICNDDEGCESCSLPECPRDRVLCETLEQCERLCYLRNPDGSFVRHKCENPESEIFDLCPQCEPTCDDSSFNCINEGTESCIAQCTCRPGLVRGPDDDCIELSQCPKCTPPAVYRQCAYNSDPDDPESECKPTCSNPYPAYTSDGCSGECEPGCECPPGFVVIQGLCMPPDMCRTQFMWFCAGGSCKSCAPSQCPRDVYGYHSRQQCEEVVEQNLGSPFCL